MLQQHGEAVKLKRNVLSVTVKLEKNDWSAEISYIRFRARPEKPTRKAEKMERYQARIIEKNDGLGFK